MVGGFLIITFAALFLAKCKAADDFDPSVLLVSDDIKAKVFPEKCPSGDPMKDESKSKCIFQRGSFFDELTAYGNDAEKLGCYVDRELVQYLGDTFGSKDYLKNPIYTRMGDDCGVCGVKSTCCGVKNAEKQLSTLLKSHDELKGCSPFWFQGMKGMPCSKKSFKPCSFKPLTSSEFALLAKLQPQTKVDKSDDCNFGQFGYSEWEAVRANPSYELTGPLYDSFLCRTMGTARPRANCVKNPATKQCMCCCNKYYPEKRGSDYECVERSDKACSKPL